MPGQEANGDSLGMSFRSSITSIMAALTRRF